MGTNKIQKYNKSKIISAFITRNEQHRNKCGTHLGVVTSMNILITVFSGTHCFFSR